MQNNNQLTVFSEDKIKEFIWFDATPFSHETFKIKTYFPTSVLVEEYFNGKKVDNIATDVTITHEYLSNKWTNKGTKDLIDLRKDEWNIKDEIMETGYQNIPSNYNPFDQEIYSCNTNPYKTIKLQTGKPIRAKEFRITIKTKEIPGIISTKRMDESEKEFRNRSVFLHHLQTSNAARKNIMMNSKTFKCHEDHQSEQQKEHLKVCQPSYLTKWRKEALTESINLLTINSNYMNYGYNITISMETQGNV